jgi:adenosylcobinamide-GDP ribazoletransferase
MSSESKIKLGCRMKYFFGGLVTAMRTLTIFPIPGRDADSMASSLPWFPIVGAILGGIVYAMGTLLTRFIIPDWPEAAAFIIVAAGIYVTRGFHLDGLSDWADSFGAMNNRKRMLEIMKDSRVGAFGVMALVMILLGQWIAVSRLCQHHKMIWIIAAYIVSRLNQVELAVTLPYARAEGGTAGAFVREAKAFHRWIAFILSVILLFVLFHWQGVTILLIGEAIRIAFGFWCNRRFGGVTGDLLGACSVITETTLLFLIAAGFLKMIN